MEAEALFPSTASLTPCQAPLARPELIQTYDLIPPALFLPDVEAGRSGHVWWGNAFSPILALHVLIGDDHPA